MDKIKVLLFTFLLVPVAVSAAWWNPLTWINNQDEALVGAPVFTPMRSLIPELDSTYWLGTTTPSTRAWLGLIVDEICLTADTCRTAWPTGGGSGGGTWSTSTSQVSGRLINYPNNNTDIVAIGSNASTTAEYWFDPNTLIAFLTGKVGIGTTSPYATLSVVGEVVASHFTGTTTATSTFGGSIAVTETNSTSTFAGGINLTDGCFGIDGTCLSTGGSGASTTLLADNNTFTGNNIFNSITRSTTTQATTTNLAVTSLSSALVRVDANGSALEYAGTSCTNQFVRSLDAVGSATCATVSASDVSLANLTATDSTLTFSGTYDGSVARTIGLNLANQNIWTGASTTFVNGVTIGNATTTNATSTTFRTGTLGVGSEYITDITGTGLTITGNALTVSNVPNSALQNSTISGISLGSNLADLTAGTGLTSAGTYNGGTARTFSLDLTAQNIWTGASTTFVNGVTFTNSTTTNATSTTLAVSGTGTSTRITNNINIGGNMNVGGSATNTFTNGISLASGCFAINGTCLSGSGGGGTPGGSDGQVQYNNGGSFGGGTDFIWDDANNYLGIGTATPDKILTVTGNQSGGIMRIDRRVTSATDITYGTQIIQATHDVNMGDGFGVAQTYNIQDNAGVSNIIGDIRGRRNGADTTGAMSITARKAGAVDDYSALTVSGLTSSVGIGTSTPAGATLVISSSTASQLKLTDGSLTSVQHVFRSMGNTFDFSTSSPSTFATSTVPIFSVDANGFLKFGNPRSIATTTQVRLQGCSPATQSTRFAPGGAYWGPLDMTSDFVDQWAWYMVTATSSSITCKVQIPQNLAPVPNPRLISVFSATTTTVANYALDIDIAQYDPLNGLLDVGASSLTNILAGSTTASQRLVNRNTAFQTVGTSTSIGSTLTAGNTLLVRFTYWGADADDTSNTDLLFLDEESKLLVDLMAQ